MAKTCRLVTLDEEFTGLLQFDDHAVVCRKVGQLVQSAEHVVAHARENQPFCIDCTEMRSAL
jgi:hypothetical protein